MTDPTPEELMKMAKKEIKRYRAVDDRRNAAACLSAYGSAVLAAERAADAVAKRRTRKWRTVYSEAWR